MIRFSTRNISWAALVLSLLVLVTSNLNFASSQDSKISGCANKKSGALRIANKCNASERSITWQVQGPQGIPGPKGDSGTTGTTTVVTQSITQKVYDSTGTLIGDYLSIDSQGSATVNKSGSIITYGGGAYVGNVIINGFSYYLTNTCTGSKYASLANRSNFTVENPYVSADVMSRNVSDYVLSIGYTQGDQIIKTAGEVFSFSNGVCVPSSSEASGDGPVTKIKLLTALSIPTKATPPYSVR